MIKQAVILSAGLGTRLRPLTDDIPKVMVPVLGKPLLLWHIEQFKKHGVSEFFINVHYLPDVIQYYFGDGSKFGVRIIYNFEPTILGTAGGLKKFEDKLDDIFFLIYGDTFSLVDYSKMEAFWKTKPDAIGMQRVGRSDNYADVDTVELDEKLKFVKIHAKPHKGKYNNPQYRLRGVFMLRKDILSFIPPDLYYEIGKNLLPDVISKGKSFYGYECDDYSKGIDIIEKLQEVERYLRDHKKQ